MELKISLVLPLTDFVVSNRQLWCEVHCLVHCTALHYTALNCTALYCGNNVCPKMWNAFHFGSFSCWYLNLGSLIKLHYTALHYTALHCTALNCTVLHCTALHCTALHCQHLSPSSALCSSFSMDQATNHIDRQEATGDLWPGLPGRSHGNKWHRVNRDNQGTILISCFKKWSRIW
jgi:hypothetical protein